MLPSITPCAFWSMEMETIDPFISHLQLPIAWPALVLLPSIQHIVCKDVG